MRLYSHSSSLNFEGTTVFRNVRNDSSNDTASPPGRIEFLSLPLFVKTALLSSRLGSNTKDRIRNNSTQGNGRINTERWVGHAVRMGARDIPKWPGKLEHREETQRKIPKYLGRRDREDFEEKNWWTGTRVCIYISRLRVLENCF